MKLFILCWSFMASIPVMAQYNILDYGAKNDTSQLSTDAINKAIANWFNVAQ